MTVITKDNGQRSLPFDAKRLTQHLQNIASEFDGLDVDKYIEKNIRFFSGKESVSAADVASHLIREAESLTSIEEPRWNTFAQRLFLKRLYKRAARNRFYSDKTSYGPFVGLLETLGERGVYSKDLFIKYSQEELAKAGRFIVPERDLKLTYNGLSLLSSRYLATPEKGEIYELPQERWLVIALCLMQDEAPKKRRMELVKEAYWALSNLYMTVATPTLQNAGRVHGQYSSCFVLSSGDSLQSIYDTNTDAARVSKHGGGVGVYMGHVRAEGSSIRGVKGASGGVIPWIKQLNNTAVSVDQLGQRKGAITVTVDVWHKDIMGFLDLRLNNGDQRLRAHDIFTCVSIPDLFMEIMQKRGEWYLFDPHEVYVKKGWRLEQSFDERKGKGLFRERYYELVEDESVSRTVIPALDIMKRIMISQLETGTPFMFYRDSVNRANPNSHKGMVYSSNLCVAPETMIQTDEGDVVISTKVDQEVVVYNGGEYSKVIVRKTGVDQALLKVAMKSGKTLDATHYHQWPVLINEGDNDTYEMRQTDQLNVGDRIYQGFDVVKCEAKEIEVVAYVEDEGRRDDTYCFTEPLRGMGVFNGILTGQCMEISQNMSPTEVTHEVVSGDQIVITKQSGDFVVCNLSSVNLGAYGDLDQTERDRLLEIQVRMLDNVIELNTLPVPQATITNHRYRAIGLGTFGWHHYLAKKGIHWESDAAVTETDEIYENINRAAIKASSALAKEKGAYPYFQGSQWDTGVYFDQRQYTGPEWDAVRDDVKANGMRNGYIMAVAPNMSTAQIAGSTASIDPVFAAFYYEEKKDYRRPEIAPDLNVETFEFYERGAYRLDQLASVRQNIARQRHVDQAISFNFYVPSTIPARKLLELHTRAWEGGIKTTYYVRSNDMNVEECSWCT